MRRGLEVSLYITRTILPRRNFENSSNFNINAYVQFINFEDLKRDEEGVVRRVLTFVGADEDRFRFCKQKAGMKGDYKGAQLHPSVRQALQRYFAEPNMRLARLLGREMFQPYSAV